MGKANPFDNIPTNFSSASEWIAWHRALKSRYGNSKATRLFLQNWGKNGSYEANTQVLRSYAQSQGFEIEGGIGTGIYDGAVGFVGGINQGFLSLGNSALIGVLIVILIAGLAAYSLLKPSNATSSK